MLAYILAIAVALGSIVLYMAAFFFPEVHRKNDFYWSFLGFFYALVLWICAGRITGGVLLGQTASVVLLGWMGWQTLTLRKIKAPVAEQTEISPEVQQQVKSLSVGSLLQPVSQIFRKKSVKTTPSPTETTTETATPLSSEAALQEIAKSEAIPANPQIDITSSSIEELTQKTASLDIVIPNKSESTLENAEGGETDTITNVENSAVPPQSANPEMVAEAQIQDNQKSGTVGNVEEAVAEAAQPRIDNLNIDENTPISDVAPEAELAPPAEVPSETNAPESENVSELPEKTD